MMVPQRILIIDNSLIQCQALSRIFGKLGYDTLIAYEGAQGFTLASLNAPHLIILDLLLPDQDGFQVYERLKQDAQTQPIPLILFTGRTRIADILRGFAAGADMFITKELGYEKLVSYTTAILAEQDHHAEDSDQPRPRTIRHELLKSLVAAFNGLVRPRLELALGTAAAAVLQTATEKLPAGWQLEALHEGMDSYLAVRGAVVEFNIFVSEVFNLLEERLGSIEVSHLREAFEQQSLV